jgi:hypothetical protein
MPSRYRRKRRSDEVPSVEFPLTLDEPSQWVLGGFGAPRALKPADGARPLWKLRAGLRTDAHMPPPLPGDPRQ